MNKQSVGFLQEKEFEIGDTSFRVTKLLPMEGFDLLETVRPGLTAILDDIRDLEIEDGDTTLGRQKTLEILVSLVAKLPREIITGARAELFRGVEFKNELAKDYQPLGGREDEGFAGLHPINVYIVIVRAFAVNFFDYGDDLSWILGDLPTSESPDTGTSPSSSQTR